jgi:hypothetical protein
MLSLPRILRRVRVLLVIFAAVFGVTFLAAPLVGDDWFWDAGNGVGFAAYAGLLYLTITSTQRIDVRAHQVLGYGVLFVAVAHAFWFMLGDGVVVEFVKIGAPDYMWHGIVSVLLLGILITVALVPDRLKVHRNYPGFRYWHRVIAVATIATATYHIVVSNFYLGAWYQWSLFVALAAAVAFGRPLWSGLGRIPIVTPAVFVLVSLAFATVFSAIRNIPG